MLTLLKYRLLPITSENAGMYGQLEQDKNGSRYIFIELYIIADVACACLVSILSFNLQRVYEEKDCERDEILHDGKFDRAVYIIGNVCVEAPTKGVLGARHV